jgi:hypothetical protein
MRLAGPPFDPPATEWMETPIARPGVWSKPRPANLDDYQRQSTQSFHGTPLSLGACKSSELICRDRTVAGQPTRARRPYRVASLQPDLSDICQPMRCALETPILRDGRVSLTDERGWRALSSFTTSRSGSAVASVSISKARRGASFSATVRAIPAGDRMQRTRGLSGPPHSARSPIGRAVIGGTVGAITFAGRSAFGARQTRRSGSHGAKCQEGTHAAQQSAAELRAPRYAHWTGYGHGR